MTDQPTPCDTGKGIGKGIGKIGSGIALAALIVCCTWLEVSGVEGGAGDLWVLVVVWAIFF